jgi:hypothetical protein
MCGVWNRIDVASGLVLRLVLRHGTSTVRAKKNALT